MIPEEVPYRETLHDEGEDDTADDVWVGGIGHLRELEWWGRKEDADEFYAEVDRRDEARKRLGGFGFRA